MLYTTRPLSEFENIFVRGWSNRAQALGREYLIMHSKKRGLTLPRVVAKEQSQWSRLGVGCIRDL